MVNRDNQIQLLQENLSSIRKIAGWTAEELGNQIGVTKQTISNLENSKVKMSLTHYIAIRSVLDYEIESNKDNTVLKKVMAILVDNGGELGEESYSEIKETVNVVAASALSGISGVPLERTFTTLLKTPSIISALMALGIVINQSGKITGIIGQAAAGTAKWLKNIIK